MFDVERAFIVNVNIIIILERCDNFVNNALRLASAILEQYVAMTYLSLVIEHTSWFGLMIICHAYDSMAKPKHCARKTRNYRALMMLTNRVHRFLWFKVFYNTK